MEKSLILKSQANDVLKAIKARGLDPGTFQWKEQKSHVMSDLGVSVLVHGPTGFYYVFDFGLAGHRAVRSPGGDTSAPDKVSPESWELQLDCVREWLGCVKREIEAPDLWAEVLQEKALPEAAAARDAQNTPFTTDELQYISDALGEIKEYVTATANLSEEHVEFAAKRLDYLADAAKRQGRQDWLHTAIGVIFTIAVGAALEPGAARELFRFVAGALRQVLGDAPALP